MAATTGPLRAGIFAAGVGSRLRRPDGGPKALTPIAGRALIDWILADLETAGASEVVIIINERSPSVRDHVSRQFPSRPVQWIVETTRSSMHSFLRVLETLASHGDEGPFLMATVDTIAPPGTFRMFIDAAHHLPPADVVMALTTRIDDDHPLKVEIGPGGEVLAFGEGTRASAGYSLVRSSVLREAANGREADFKALRVFFRHLLECGYRFQGLTMPDSIDVDRPADIEAAERMLRAYAR